MVFPADIGVAQVALKAWLDSQIGPAFTQVVDVAFAGNADGTYTATINGTDHDFVAVSQTLAQVIDGLAALINAGAENALVTASNVGDTTLRIVSDTAGTAFAYLFSSAAGASAMTPTLTTMNRAAGLLLGMAAGAYATIWGNQDGHRPALPYAVMSIPLPPAGLGMPSKTTIDNGDDTFDRRYEYDARFTFRVELLSRAPLGADDGVDETMPLLAGLEASLRTEEQIEMFTAAGIAFIENRDPLAIPRVMGFGTERRGQLDLVFGTRVRVDVPNVPVLDSGSLDEVLATVEDGDITGSVGTAT